MELTGTFVLLVPIVMAVVEAVKRAGMDTRFAPLLAIVLGVASTLFLGSIDVLQGLLVGLTSAGLFSGVKTTVGR